MFEAVQTFFGDMWYRIATLFTGFSLLTTIIDILLVATVIYSLIKLVRDSRAEQLIKGILLLVAVYLIAVALNLQTLTYIMGLLFDNALILVVVVFQPEIRRALEHFGHSSFSGAFAAIGRNSKQQESIDNQKAAIMAVCGAVEQLQRQHMGALIVFERRTKLGEIVASGTMLDADPSAELIANVFFNKAPLHDGAMIIRDGRVFAAGCILPLTAHQSLSSSLGTRHRAAVGMSENSDALIVVVSEETAAISLAQSGKLTRDYTPKTLRIALENGMLSDVVDDEQRGILKKLFKGKEDAS